MERTIDSREELRALRPRSARRGLRRVALAMSGDAAAVRSAELTINRGLRACGCETAALFLVGGVLGVGLAVGLLDAGLFESVSSSVATLAVLGTLTFAGKVMGLAVAEWRLREAIDRVTHEAGGGHGREPR